MVLTSHPLDLTSHPRIVCLRETVLDTEEISIQANNYQMVMAFQADMKPEISDNWNLHLQNFTTTLIEIERTRIQNLMIGGILFSDSRGDNAQKEVEDEISILKSGSR